MLKDRKVLIERELARAKQDAANMYLSIVVSGHSLECVDYHRARTKVTELETDLSIINSMIEQGSE
jgi:hypothetical protein